MTQFDETHPFVTYLLTKQANRAVLADLRRGLMDAAGEAVMYRHVLQLIPANVRPGSWEWRAYLLTAGLFALHPQSATGTMGNHFAAALDPNGNGNDSIERRFSQLLVAHPDDLPFQLRQAISYLRSREIGVNWHRLLRDLRSWGYEDGRVRVQRVWADDFWRRSPAADKQQP